MKLTKRLFALALVLCMLACLCVSVCAVEGDGEGTTTTPTYTDHSTVTLTKIYKVVNAGTKAPAETFELEVVGDGTPTITKGEADAATAPKLTNAMLGKAEFATGTDKTDDTNTVGFVITLPTGYTRVGEYRYTIKETAGNTAGVSYHSDNITVVVSVIEDATNGQVRIGAVHAETSGSTKVTSIVNTYSAGNLEIKKTVTGTLGDKNQYFAVDVKLTGVDGQTYENSYAISGGSYQSNPTSITVGANAATTIYIKHDETVKIENLPYGVTYTVTEHDYTDTDDKSHGYKEPVYSGDTGENAKIDAATQTVTIANEKGGTPDMGVSLDSLPYILALVLACGGAVVLFTRKRHIED